MRRRWMGYFLIFSLFTSSLGFAEETTEPLPKGKVVGKAAADSAQAMRTKQWQNWTLAGAATVVAVVTLVLVAQHHHHH